MPRDATATRNGIMDAAEGLILSQGFAATSVDKVVEAAGVTKGSFFYHFKTKTDLAHALVGRWAEADLGHLQSNMARAEALSRDPLQQVLIFIGLFLEMMSDLEEPPNCLFASICYEADLFDDATLDVIRGAMGAWRERLGAKFAEVVAAHPPRLDVDAETLADMMTVTFEGAFVMSMSLDDPALVARQLEQYRNYVELLFRSET